MRATILTIGDEILIGQITDTNATYMAAALSEEGITVVEHLSVADSRIGIMGGLDRALQQSDIVLMTGGLGPTKDDMTKQVLADYFGAELRLHNPTWKRLQKIYSRLGREASEAHRQQCRLPTGAKVLTNERGTAPGLWMEKDDQIVISMPGVPYEMMYLMDQEVMRRLKNHHLDAEVLRSVTLLTAGEGESTIAERLEAIEDGLPENMSLAYLPNLGTVRLRISARGQDEDALRDQLNDYRGRIEAALGKLVYGYGIDDLASVTARLLQEQRRTLATAESCTGGQLGEMITSRPGASQHYVGGVVAYANRLKTALLGVPEATLEEFGAVSQETVTAMAEGARERLGSDYALATSGIAGPGGGTPDKPVGTIWIALATPETTLTKLLRRGKDRQRNIEYTCLQALNLLRLHLADGAAPAPPPAVEKPKAPRKARKATPKAKKQAPPAAAPEESAPQSPAATEAETAPAPKKKKTPAKRTARKTTAKTPRKKAAEAPTPPETDAPQAPARPKRTAMRKPPAEPKPAGEPTDTQPDAKPKRKPVRKK